MTLLVPTDFSAVSRNAIEYLLKLLRNIQEPYRVLLLHTYLIPTAAPDKLISINDELKKRSLEGLQKELDWIKTRDVPSNIVFESLSYMGSLKNIIFHIIQVEKVELVVLGMNRVGKKEELLSIVNQIASPFLIVPF